MGLLGNIFKKPEELDLAKNFKLEYEANDLNNMKAVVDKFAKKLNDAKRELGLHDVIQFYVVKTCTHCISKGYSRDCLNALFDDIKNGEKIYLFKEIN